MPVSKNIVFMGDSITAGDGVFKFLRWTSLLNEYYLNSIFKNDTIQYNFINEGISGENTDHAIKRINKVMVLHKPHIIFLQYGLNDCKFLSNGIDYQVPVKKFSDNLKNLITHIIESPLRKVYLLTSHPTLRDEISSLVFKEPYELRRQAFNREIKSMSTFFKSVELIDIDNYFRSFSSNFENSAILSSDGVHLSEYGHKKYVEIISNYLFPILCGYES
jgi:lysophospholipase L1-like esterase